MGSPNDPEDVLPQGWHLWVRVTARIVFLIVIFGTILFGAAGRFDWLAAWLLLILFAIYLLVFIAWGTKRSPELMRERSRVAPNVKTWDKVVNALYTVLLIALLVVAGLDAGRFGWSVVPPAIQLFGWIGLVASGYIIWRVVAENPYASRFARIQDDRGQIVVSSGPYRFVRHPMYAGIVLLMVCLPLALGSWWALVPGILISALYVVRTALEDRMLLEELPGYAEYAEQTRYRLLPGGW